MSAREVSLMGGSPWGFRMHGGCDQHQPLRISRVNPGSKAAQQGVREGDLISSINGKSTRDLTNGEAHALLRNAGDQLKLGLNQENGSPKRRIYKSSLQENTSIETIKKTTTKTTTSTQIISTETKKNGTDDAKNEPSYENQNGNLKINSTSQQEESDKKYESNGHIHSSQADFLDYATDNESISCLGIKMPCGSRSRRNKRNRQRKRFQHSSSPPKDVLNNHELTKVTEEETPGNFTESIEEELKEKEELEKLVNGPTEEVKQNGLESLKKEAKIDGATLKITTEKLSPEKLPFIENMSTARSRIMRRNKIEKKVLNADTQICEITTIRNAVPLEARLDHIAGVGIVESSLNAVETPTENLSSTVTISEPTEPVEPLSEDLATKVENLPGIKTCMTVAIPMKRFDFLEIHEMTDSEIEGDTNSSYQKPQQQGIIIEAESDFERESSIEDSRKEDPKKEKTEDENDDNMPWEIEKQLRSFIEGLRLPSSPTETVTTSVNNKLHEIEVNGWDIPRGSSKTSSTRKRGAVAGSLGSYQSHLSQESNRCLDIIQEEGESKNLEEETSSSDEKIRDFINEEIGKFRRERRDLKSVLREDRLSVEMEEEEENAVEAQEKIDKVKDTDSEVIKTEVKEQKQEKEISSIENKNENKRKDEIDESQCKKVCDININDEKKEKTKTVLVQESDTESTFAQHENVETFMNLVKSLKERVINEVRLEKMEKSQEANKSHCQSMEENNVKEEYVTNKIESSSHNFEIQKNQEIPEIKCVTNTVESSEKSKDFMTQEKNVMNKDELNQQSKNITVEKTKIECDKNNTQLKQESENLVNKNNVKNENISEIVENLDKIKNVNKEINSNKVVNITNENAVLVKVEGNSKITEPEVNLVPENSLKKDVVKVKNNESSSGASLKEVVIHNVKQIDINNEITKITNDTILNDEEDNKNNDDNIASKTQLSNVDANCINNDETPNVIKTNTSKSNVEISGIKNRFFDISITEEITKEEEKENNVEVTVTEIENVESTKPNDSNKETKIEESLTKIPSKSEIAKENKTENKESKEKIFTKDEILNSFSKEKKIDVSKTQLKQQNEEPESPTPIETITTSGYAENETESPEEIPKIEEHSIPIIFENIFFSDNPPEIPPPPLRSSFRPPDVPDLPFDFPFCEGLIFIERVPPPPPVRNHNIVFVTDSRYPSEFPFYPQQASKFAMFHQRAMNAFDIDEQLETIDFIKSLLTILSHQETTRQDVQNLLSLYDIEKLPPNIRGIIDDLMAPTPSMSSAASTTSDVGGFTDLCNELYELADYKTGIDASLEIASANSNEAPPVPPHRKKFAYTRVEGEEIPPRPLSPSKPVQKPENHSSEKLLTAEHIPRPQIVRNVVSPDFQGHHQHQDSSNSTTSPNTTKYNPVKSSVADITVKDIPKPPGSDPNDNKSLPKSQSLLLNSKEEEKEKSNSKAESSQPISFSSADDHLYYVPLLDEPSTATATNLGANKNDDKIHKSDEFSLPGSLKDLCMKKIMSMPRGEKLIDEIPAPKLNTFNNSNNIQNCSTGKNSNTNKDGMPSKIEKISDKTIKKETYESHREEKTETFSSTKKITEIKEITNQKRKNWTGVPTKQNPKVLVCFSPAQQETEVKTTADNLLDLHKKFINRRGYYHDHSQSISPPKYFVDISPKMEAPEPPIKGSSRLLNIIKENPIPANKKQQKQDQQPNGLISQSRQNGIEKVSTHDENQERLRATRLNDWLSLARRDNSTTASGNILIEHTDKQQQQQQNCYHENVFNKRSGSPLPPRNVTPTALRKSPISFNSAIIDKSQEYRRPPTITGRAPYTIIDPWYINPALIIEDKPEVPPRVKRTVTVDRDCIDTRSIFDQTPVTPKSKNLENPEVLKQMPAVEIMENLKQLQTGMKERIDKRNRYSLPQEYFDKQLKYIETLENQLKEVIIAEEKEKKAAEEFKKEIEKKKNKPRPYSMSESSFLDRPSHKTTYQQSNNTLNKDNQINKNNDNTTHKDQWKESSKKVDGDNVEFESKEGSREIKNEVKNENGFYSKTSSEKIEKKEEHHVTTTNINKELPEESKLKTFLRDLHDPKIDKMHCSSETNKSATSNDTEKRERPKLERPVSIAAIPTNGEVFRQQMYDEYVHKVHEREERKHHKVIKISSHSDLPVKKSIKRCKDLSNLNKVEREFIEKAQSRLNKYGIKLDESETEGGASSGTDLDAKFLVDGKEIKDVKNLPKHLQEFLRLSAKREEEKEEEEQKKNGVWSPGSESTKPQKPPSPERGKDGGKDEAIPPVWTPSSAGPSPVPERKEFRPVPFESPVLSRKKITQQPDKSDTGVPPPPWKEDEQKKEASQVLSHNIPSSRIVNSYSAPNALAGAPRLPRAQNPTITLLQKAREGQLPKGAAYLDEADQSSHRIDGERPLLSPGEVIYTLKKEYESEPESENAPPKKMADLGPRKYEGIGPTTRAGVPIVLRSEVKEDNKAKWYKRMYDSLHRAPKDDDYITIRYKPHRGTRTGYSGASSGYLSEPEPRSYTERSATLDNRRHRQRNKENDFSTSTLPRHAGRVDGHYSPDTYHMNPGRIEDYIPGNCSIQEKEAKEPPSDLTWAKRKPFEQPSTHSPKSYMTHALKESGYESDSTLVFRRREDASPLSPLEQRIAYKTVQKGGDVPLHGLRKPAPERPKEYTNAPPPPPPKAQHYRGERQESPRRYVEGEVTIHYRSPVRAEAKEPLSEEELARRSAENMRRVYQEERRRKYLQELHDIDSRRHTDNFIPSQKSPIPLNRYDDFIDDLSYRSRSQEQTPEPRLVARALYNFVGQSPRELTFRRGDLIFVRRQVDKNWYEGEHNAMIGLFPFNYVEIIPYDEIRTLPKKPYEGQARAKFNFIAQTNLELSLSKGELVYLTRRVDENWWEGRIGNRKGIFPVSYVEVISEPGHRPETPVQGKPVASPAAHSLLTNGSAGGKLSMGPHHYTPSLPVNINTTQPHYNSLPKGGSKVNVAPLNEALHIDTHSEPIPYRALYNYRPQNDDELELNEGDTVYVMEKCDDGWYVGSSQRTGYFGTFPGNYVERL